VGAVASNGVAFTVLPTPVVSSLNPASASVGSPVTITGTNFGTTQGSSTVTFNGTAATPNTWSATSIVVPVPAGATNGNVVVTVGGVASNGVAFTVVQTPVVSSVNPSSASVGSLVTVAGTSFGATQGTSTVMFNGTAATPTSWSATSIVVPVPAGAANGNVVVTVGGVASNGVAFTVLQTPTPVISSLSISSATAGTPVTITGTNFGATQGTSSVTFNGIAATPTSWSATSIVAPVPAGATSGNVVVTVGGVASNGVAFTVVPTLGISGLSPAAAAAGTLVTISGTNFGAAQGFNRVTFNGTAATPTAWSATSIVAQVPAAATSGNVVVTVGGVASNGFAFTVLQQGQGPVISTLSPTSAVAGTPVTIIGTSFGATQGTSTVAFNGTAATPSSWSATSIVTTVPAGATKGNVVVTVGGVASNGALFTVLQTPNISSLSPVSAAVGIPVTINGTNFGATQGTSTVTFNGTAAIPSSWAVKVIVVPVPVGATSGNVVVTVSGLASNGVAFTVSQTPSISGLNPASAIVGTPVTITGANFGSTQASSTVTFNGTLATPTSWSAASIVAAVPVGASSGNVVVTVGGVASNGAAFTVAQAPTISSLSLASAAVGTPVTISGTNFGATQGTSSVTFNGTPAPATSWSAASIVVQVPAGATSGNVVVTVAGLVSNGVGFTVLQPPAISSLSLSSAAVGTPVTIAGTNFGAAQGTSSVTFNGTAATPTSWSATNIVVPVPAAATSGNVVVTVGGMASNGVAFTVLQPPAISSLSLSSAAVGTPVTITGTNFGATQGTSAVKFNGTVATPTSWSATSIVAPVPAGATNGNVVVTVGGMASNGVAFTVLQTQTPVISSLSLSSAAVGTPVTITGTNFGTSQGTSTVKFNGTAATPTSWSATSIVAPVPAAATSGNVVVTVGGAASNGLTFTVLPTPVISSLSVSSAAVGTAVTVTGTNFGATQGTSTVKFNGTAATPSSWSATSVVVTVPAGATSGNVVVTVGGGASNGVAFTVLSSLSISSLSPTSGAAGTKVTITGTNFGAAQGFNRVSLNGMPATPTSWSATSIVVVVPTGASSGNVVVTVGGVASNGVPFTVLP
jgi:hypothetical protein